MSRKSVEIITRLYEQRLTWSDDAILEELSGFAVLPDEDDSAWERDETWQNAYLFIALADVAARKRLYPAILLLLERASYGDPGEMMRGLRHNLERIVSPDWSLLLNDCMKAATYPQPGARLWAMHELGTLRDGRAIEVVIGALEDQAKDVRLMARRSLGMICRDNPQCRAQTIDALKRYIKNQNDTYEIEAATKAISDIEAMGAN